MNGEQEYASAKSPMTVVLWILLIAALVWAIVASTMATRRGSELARAKSNFDQLRQEYDQALINMQAREADIERKIQTAEEMRRVALDWKNQYMAKIEALNKAKAATTTKSTSSSSSKSSRR